MTCDRQEEAIVVDQTVVKIGKTLDFHGHYLSYGKRLFDVVLACLGLLIAAPAMLIIAVVIWFDHGSPIFAHERVGYKGRRFKCLKFRTMRLDAAQQLEALLEKDPIALEEWEKNQKLTHDPRITLSGRWLRATSLDELPQIINVIRGDMSLVGPRPVTETELVKYEGSLCKYFAMRPGITGIWQVHGRGEKEVDYAGRIEMDTQYFNSINFIGDVLLMFKTVAVVIRLKGQ